LEGSILDKLKNLKEEIMLRFTSWSLANYSEIIEIVKSGNMQLMTNLQLSTLREMISLEDNLISKLNSKKEIREKETSVEINTLAIKF